MTRSNLIRALATATLLTVSGAQAAFAHVGLADHAHGALDGFLHPLTGLDHLAAMVAVGLWSATIGGRALLALPAAFVALLIGGAVLGAAGLELPAAETVITASVIVLGLAVALGVRPPLLPSAAIVALFGLFHGYAHGAEMPAIGSPLGYGLGFVAASALLHLGGIGLGLGLGRLAWGPAARAAGAAVAVFGVLLAVAG